MPWLNPTWCHDEPQEVPPLSSPPTPPNPLQAAKRNIPFQLTDLEHCTCLCAAEFAVCSLCLGIQFIQGPSLNTELPSQPGCLPQAPVCVSGIASLSLLPSKWILWLHRELRLSTLHHTRLRCLKETVQIPICLVNNSVNSNGTMRRFPPTLHLEVKFVSFSHLWVLAIKQKVDVDWRNYSSDILHKWYSSVS